MRVLSYADGEGWTAGIRVGDRVVPATEAARRASLPPESFGSVRELIARPQADLSTLGQAAEACVDEAGRELADVRLGPPIPDPEKIICVALNYRDHAEEAGLAIPVEPVLFAKYRNTLIGPEDAVELSPVSDEYDYEAELGVVIGRRVKGADVGSALDAVAGYMPFNDVTARDVQFRTSQWTAGKTLDTTAPCGPELVLADEVPDPQDLAIRCRLNGVVMQEGSTRNMIFSCAELIAFISSLITLVPGDIIATGTPAGVGFKRQPPVYLRDGDVLETEVESLGVLRTHMVAAPVREEVAV